MKYKIVYTCGKDKFMVDDLKVSVESALRFCNSNDIIVIFTPPYNIEDVDFLKDMCNVIVKDTNLTEPFILHRIDTYTGLINTHETPRLYGEKLWITTLPYKDIMFLDCDTYIYNDPEILFDGDFEFGGMAIDYPKKDDIPWQIKYKLLPRMKRIYHLSDNAHIWNGGHLVFKNHLHNKIKDTWIKYFNDKPPMRVASPLRNTDDQLSLTPTLDDFPDVKVRLYMEDEIFKCGLYNYKWKHKLYSDKVVIFHGDKLKENLYI